MTNIIPDRLFIMFHLSLQFFLVTRLRSLDSFTHIWFYLSIHGIIDVNLNHFMIFSRSIISPLIFLSDTSLLLIHLTDQFLNLRKIAVAH